MNETPTPPPPRHAADAPELLPEDLRVLVVDDEEEILELLGEYLKARGYSLRSAYDGQDALEILRSGGADIVLTDMKMPHVDGLELLEEARRMPRPVAVILMTGFGTVETAIRSLKRGAYDYLLKPFKLRDVHTALVRAAGRLEQERQAARVRELLGFYEMAHSITGPDDLPRLYGLLAAVARAETAAEEVAVWLRGPGGWEAAARGGQVDALGAFDPDDLAGPRLDAGIAATPIWQGRQRAGALAVAGGAPREPAHLARLELLARVLGFAISQAGAAADPEPAPSR